MFFFFFLCTKTNMEETSCLYNTSMVNIQCSLHQKKKKAKEIRRKKVQSLVWDLDVTGGECL